MRKTFAIAIAAAVAVTGVMTGAEAAPAPQTAPAQSLDQVRAQALAEMNAGKLQTVRDRRGRGGRHFSGRRGGGWGGGRHYGNRRYYGGRGHYGNRRYYGGRRYYYGRRHDRGGYLAAGALGLAAGAIIAGAASQPRYHRGSSYCAQRFRSYNPRTGTYTANDGRQIACP